MKYLLGLSFMILFLTVGSTTTYAQSSMENCPPACKKVCEKICGKSATAKTTAMNTKASEQVNAKASCVATCKKMATNKTATAKEESSADFVQTLLVSQKIEASPKTNAKASKCNKANSKKACCSRKE